MARSERGRIHPLRDSIKWAGTQLEATAAETVNRYWEYLRNNKWFYFIVVGGLLALWLEDHAIIIATGILGASLVIGGYPNEMTLYDEIKAGNTSSFSWQFIIYLIVMGIFCVLSIIWQERQYKSEDEDSKERRHNYIKMRKASE